MKNKKYIFILMIMIIIYLLIYILNYKYKEYQVNKYISNKIILNKKIREKILLAEKIIKYKKSKAYGNKVLKQQKWLKWVWEKVIYLTPEKEYNKYTKNIINIDSISIDNNMVRLNNITKSMNIYQKWVYFLFKIDIR